MSDVETDTDARLSAVLDTHFDPKWGSSYWLDRVKQSGFDPRCEVKRVEDLPLLGAVTRDALTSRSITDLIPKKYHHELNRFVTAETGGSTGAPARTAYMESEFRAAFIDPFLAAAELVEFPRDEHWLFIGPSGPHIIGKAARECAVALGSIDPFSVDFDPRWIQKLTPGSMAIARYVEHVLVQAEAILATQDIGVLFATPPVLTALAERLPDSTRERIRGVHLGGMAADAEFWRHLTTEWYPNSIALAGYGNSLAGMCPQLELIDGVYPVYYPHGDRLIVTVAEPLEHDEGRVLFHRLDHSSLLPNMFERDRAGVHVLEEAIPGFRKEGIINPCSVTASPVTTGALY